MDIRMTLVPLMGARTDEAALVAAHTLAGSLGAQVEGLFVHPHPRRGVVRIGEAASMDIINKLHHVMEEGTRRRDVAYRYFEAAGATRALADDGNLAPPRWREVQEMADFSDRHDPVVQAARLADLVVFARSRGHYPRSMFEAVLLGAGRPVLIAPTPSPCQIGSDIAIAWNNTCAATRAVCAAMSVLRKARRVQVLTIETWRTRGTVAAELVEHLRRHDVEAQTHCVQANGTQVGRLLLTTAGEMGADLLVMGGYGHSRLRELLLGRVTRHVLDHAPLPVLMAH